LTAQNTIFISYRRVESIHQAGRIYDDLVAHFGKAAVFKDVDSIPAGVDFRSHLNQVLATCQAACVIVGPAWLSQTTADGQRRLDGPQDFVRIEVEALLARNIPVIPILIDGATIPAADDLPESLQALSFRQAVAVRADPDFHHDMEKVIAALKQILGASAAGRTNAPAGKRTPSLSRAKVGIGIGVAVPLIAVAGAILYTLAPFAHTPGHPTLALAPTATATATAIPFTPTPTLVPTTGCPQTFYTGAGVNKDIAVAVPNGCDIVGAAFTGTIGPYTWGANSPSAVYALPAGTYYGNLRDGDYFVKPASQARAMYCSLVQQVPNAPHYWPLPTWAPC
jgi:hypothetical protein